MVNLLVLTVTMLEGMALVVQLRIVGQIIK